MIMNAQYPHLWLSFGKLLTFGELILVLYIRIYNVNYSNNIVAVFMVHHYGLSIVKGKFGMYLI